MKKSIAITTAVVYFLLFFMYTPAIAQMMRLPESSVNYKCKTARQLGATDIEISWNAPGVKGRE